MDLSESGILPKPCKKPDEIGVESRIVSINQRISAIIPTRDRFSTIESAIASVQAQSLPVFEDYCGRRHLAQRYGEGRGAAGRRLFPTSATAALKGRPVRRKRVSAPPRQRGSISPLETRTRSGILRSSNAGRSPSKRPGGGSRRLSFREGWCGWSVADHHAAGADCWAARPGRLQCCRSNLGAPSASRGVPRDRGFDTAMPSCQDWELLSRLAIRGNIRNVQDILVAQGVSASSRITRDAVRVVEGHRTIHRRMRLLCAEAGLGERLVRARQVPAYLEILLRHRMFGEAAKLTCRHPSLRAMAKWARMLGQDLPRLYHGDRTGRRVT